MQRWLLDTVSNPDLEKKVNSLSLRPSTGNHDCEQPIWFKELIHGRRHSEIFVNTNSSFNVGEQRIFLPEASELRKRNQNKLELKSDIFTSLGEKSSRKSEQISKITQKANIFNEHSLLTLEDKRNSNLELTDDNTDDFRLLFIKNRNRLPFGHSAFKREVEARKRDSFTAEDIDVSEIVDVTSGEPHLKFTDDFIIPELPRGKELVIEIHSNWGDSNHVGMNGIEIFEADSKRSPSIQQASDFTFICFLFPAELRKIVVGYS